MTEAMFQRILERAAAHSTKRGPAKLPEGKTITLYLASHGASMSVANVVELSLVESVVEAKNRKGELFLLAIDDIYAASVNSGDERGGPRKAGFVG